MIDETVIIKKLDTRIDEFVKKYPQKKDCEQIYVLREFIHMLETESKNQNK